MENNETRLTSKYQTTIPQEIRKFLGVGKGDTVHFTVEDGKVSVRKANKKSKPEYMKLQEDAHGEWQEESRYSKRTQKGSEALHAYMDLLAEPNSEALDNLLKLKILRLLARQGVEAVERGEYVTVTADTIDDFLDSLS